MKRDRRLYQFFSIAIIEDCSKVVILRNADGFLAAFSILQNTRLDNDLREIRREIEKFPGQRRLVNKQQSMLRWSSLWLPCRRRLSFTALRADTLKGQPKPLTDSDDIFQLLRIKWGEVFSRGAASTDGLSKFLKNNVDPFPSFRPAALRDFVKRVRKSRSVRSHCGPDGIPAAALSADAEVSAKLTYEMYLTLCESGTPPQGFNDSLTIFPVKKIMPGESFEIVREWDELRPITMKNEDNKTIANVCNDVI